MLIRNTESKDFKKYHTNENYLLSFNNAFVRYYIVPTLLLMLVNKVSTVT